MDGTDLERIEAVAAALPVPVPWSLDTFVDALSDQRRRAIHLRPLEGPGGVDMPTGLWVPTPEVDHVFFETSTSVPHQEHIICHELAHMILRHEPDPTQPGHYLRRVFEQIDPGLIEAARARTSYRLVEEQEAETLATLILGGATRQLHTPPNAEPGSGHEWDALLGFEL